MLQVSAYVSMNQSLNSLSINMMRTISWETVGPSRWVAAGRTTWYFSETGSSSIYFTDGLTTKTYFTFPYRHFSGTGCSVLLGSSDIQHIFYVDLLATLWLNAERAIPHYPESEYMNDSWTANHFYALSDLLRTIYCPEHCRDHASGALSTHYDDTYWFFTHPLLLGVTYPWNGGVWESLRMTCWRRVIKLTEDNARSCYHPNPWPYPLGRGDLSCFQKNLQNTLGIRIPPSFIVTNTFCFLWSYLRGLLRLPHSHY